MSTREEQALMALKLAKDRLSTAKFERKPTTADERDDYRTALIAFVRASLEYAKTIQKEDDK